jgi:hypothetical protein
VIWESHNETCSFGNDKITEYINVFEWGYSSATL